MTKLVIFDFDGTLVDTPRDCVACMQETFREMNLPEHSYDDFIREFGQSLPDILKGVLKNDGVPEEKVAEAASLYRKLYAESDFPLTAPYPGMIDCLNALRDAGIRLAIYSNKTEPMLVNMTERFLPGIPFDGIIGFRDGLPPKPAPEGVYELMKTCGATPEDTVFVGDGKSDVETAKNAGIPVFFVTWGTGTAKDALDPYISVVADTAGWLTKCILGFSRENERALRKLHEINLETLKDVHEICVRHGITYFLCFGALIGALRHHDMVPWDNDIDLLMTRDEFAKLLPFLRAELDPEKYELVMPEDYGDRYLDMVPRVNYKGADLKVFSDEMNAYYDGKANKIALDFFFLDRIPENFRGKMTVLRLEFLYGLLNGKRYNNDIGQYPNGFYRFASRVLIAIGKHCRTEKLRNKVERLAVRFDGDETIRTLRMTNDTIKSFTKRFPAESFDSAREIEMAGGKFMVPVEAERVLTLFYGDYMALPPEEDRIPHLFNKAFTADLITFYGEDQKSGL